MGKTYYYSVDSLKRQENFSIPGILNPGALSFNSVDGLRTDLPFSYLKADSLGHILQVGSTLGYAFKREKLDASFRLARKWDGMSNGWFVFSLGSTTSDFNRNGGMTAIDNDFYTLWMEKNYKRFYRRDFLQLNASRDLANGLNFALTVDYSDNRQLSTHTSYSIINYDDREIQPNIPDNDLLQIGQLEDHQTLGARIQLQYTPRNRYRIRNNSKIYAGSRYPTFTMSYTKAFSGILGSDSKYDLLKLGVKQSISFGASNQFGYRIETGSFLNNDKVYFEDFRHFSALPVNFLFSPYRDSFRLLSMYSNSTNQRYVDAHANLITRKLLLKQLPILRKGSFTENLFLNYLTTLQLSNYVEAGYGISNFLMLFNLEVVAGFENGKYQSAGFKVSLNLK